MGVRALLSAAFMAAFASAAFAQDLVGHGGPVGALTAEADRLLSGALDGRAILWDLDGHAAAVVQFHAGAVTAVAFVPSGGFATGGQDGRVAFWRNDARTPVWATDPATAPVVSLIATPTELLVAYRDGRVAVYTHAGEAQGAWQAHRDRLTGAGLLPDGSLVTVGTDLSFARWRERQLRARADLPDIPNGLAISEGRVAVVFADGALRLFDPNGRLLPERFLSDRPLVAVAATGPFVAAAAVDGTVWVLEAQTLEPRHRLAPGQGPVWAMTFVERALFTAGADGRILRWDAETGERRGQDSLASAETETWDDGSRGAEVFRACAVCHTLTPDHGNRAGPSLYRIFGRRIASAEGYSYSEALKKLDIVWTPETVAALFEFGPEAYPPGSRMPEQRLTDPADRAALVEFLARYAQ